MNVLLLVLLAAVVWYSMHTSVVTSRVMRDRAMERTTTERQVMWMHIKRVVVLGLLFVTGVMVFAYSVFPEV